MLTKEKLTQLMADLESETVERTRAFDKVEKMGQAISAFANDLPGRNVPGYLLLGVDNNGQISNKRITDEQLTSLGGLKTEGALLPSPAMSIEKFSFEKGDVVAIEVFPSSYPPIRFKGQVWVRVGSRKALASDEDLHIFEERRQNTVKRFEILPCSGALLKDLDLDLFRNIYLPRAIQAEVIEEDLRTVEEQLASLRFYDPNAHIPTNLGMILFGKHPEMYIPSAYLQYVKFSGSDNGSDILAEHTYKGPLLKTITELNAFVKVGIASPHPVKVSALQEEMFYHYPDWAVRELLLNSYIHRDYQIGNAPIKFYNYNEVRLEISNPGGLYGLAKPENFPRVNDYRNPLLAEAMKVMGFVNKYNRGIAKVKTEMKKNGNPMPIFDYNKRTEFRVTLLPNTGTLVAISSDTSGKLNKDFGKLNKDFGKLNKDFGKLNKDFGKLNKDSDKLNKDSGKLNKKKRQDLILETISVNPGIRRKELSEYVHVAVRTLDRDLIEMTANIQTAKIEHRGSRKTGGWFLKS